jgi:hypothetical protein
MHGGLPACFLSAGQESVEVWRLTPDDVSIALAFCSAQEKSGTSPSTEPYRDRASDLHCGGARFESRPGISLYWFGFVVISHSQCFEVRPRPLLQFNIFHNHIAWCYSLLNHCFSGPPKTQSSSLLSFASISSLSAPVNHSLYFPANWVTALHTFLLPCTVTSRQLSQWSSTCGMCTPRGYAKTCYGVCKI